MHVRKRGRVNVLGAACYRPGDNRPRFACRLHTWHGRKTETKSFTPDEYRRLPDRAASSAARPVVLVWDNVSTHKTPELTAWAALQRWLRVFYLPRYTPELNAVEWIWSWLKRSIVNFPLAGIDDLEALVRSRLKQIQYRPDAITGCLTDTGLIMKPP
ncbi:hypothetical protein QFZ82_000341 [Streptomyces sp. V4I23]|nr:hypothetical protein [Streptomyces sp. V4I23]MDQ1005856.1 hypothetical protein [Streptomyces sp. V4I23]